MMLPGSSGRRQGTDSDPCDSNNGIFNCFAQQRPRMLGLGPQGSAELFPCFTPNHHGGLSKS